MLLDLSNLPKDAAIMPFPNDETTPPVTKTYLVFISPPVICRLAIEITISDLQSERKPEFGGFS
jgi:hypothetical protein